MNIKKWIVIEFLKDCKFPKFPMYKGERWNLTEGERFKQIKDNKSFEFAGGECSTDWIKIIYEGNHDGIALLQSTVSIKPCSHCGKNKGIRICGEGDMFCDDCLTSCIDM